jgi:hypothetical protein
MAIQATWRLPYRRHSHAPSSATLAHAASANGSRAVSVPAPARVNEPAMMYGASHGVQVQSWSAPASMWLPNNVTRFTPSKVRGSP